MTALRSIIFSGPSGAGKSTLLRMLLEKFPQCFTFTVSHTSREPRPGEVNGKDYVFIHREDMVRAIGQGKYLEYSEFNGNLYGTPLSSLISSKNDIQALSIFQRHGQRLLSSVIPNVPFDFRAFMVSFRTRNHVFGNNNRVCLLDVDANGVRAISAARPSVNARFVFVSPPSLDVLEKRLRARGTESEDRIRWRLERAKIDIDFAHGPEGRRIYSAYIVNDDLQKSVEKLITHFRDDITPSSEADARQVSPS